MIIAIPGNPKSKERPRLGKYGNFYSPTGKGEHDTGWQIYLAYKEECRKRGIKLRDPRKHLTVHVKYFYQEKRKNSYKDEANLNCWLADCIEKSGIIFNDKILRILVDDYQHRKDEKNPRTVIEICD
jgi:predicted transport protein